MTQKIISFISLDHKQLSKNINIDNSVCCSIVVYHDNNTYIKKYIESAVKFLIGTIIHTQPYKHLKTERSFFQ